MATDDYDTLLKKLGELKSIINKEYERLTPNKESGLIDHKLYEMDCKNIEKKFEEYEFSIWTLRNLIVFEYGKHPNFDSIRSEAERLLEICDIVLFNCRVENGNEYYEEIGIVDK